MAGGGDSKERFRQARMVGVAVTIPFIMVAAPLVGLFGGQWLDAQFGTEPWLKISGTVLGLMAGGYQVYMLMRQIMRDLD